jgi:hypothetical protein
MLTVALSSGATICTARRGVWRRGGLPHSSGTFRRGRFFGHTHTLVEDGMGPPPFSRTARRQRQPGGGAPARAGAQQVGTRRGRSPEHGLVEERAAGVTTPPSISRSSPPTTQSTSQSRPAHRIPDSPKQQQPLLRRRALARNDEEVARAQDEMVLSSGSGSGAARRLRNTPPAAAAPTTLPFGPLELQQPPVVVAAVGIPEGGGAEPPLPSTAYLRS